MTTAPLAPVNVLALPDIAAMLRALDAGDDGALGPLSDALEEAGEVALAAGLRVNSERLTVADIWAPLWRPTSLTVTGEAVWFRRCAREDAAPNTLRASLFRRLRGGKRGRNTRTYPSRSLALLALAAALAGP